MKRGRYESTKQGTSKWIVFLLIILIICITILIACFFPKPIQANLPNGSPMEIPSDVVKKTDSIAIPGYEGITLNADTKQQTIGFPNPSQNTCYFQISLMLEDGTLLWQSELIEPGNISDPITLNQPLETGTYPNAVLKFDCYTMDGTMSALNGAATQLTIRVR